MWRNFILTTIILLLSGFCFYLTFFNLDPFSSQNKIAFLAFFLSIFAGVASFFTLLFFFGAEVVRRKKLKSHDFAVAIRRGTFVGIFVVSILVLQLFRFLGILEFVLIAAFLSVLEFVFLTAK